MLQIETNLLVAPPFFFGITFPVSRFPFSHNATRLRSDMLLAINILSDTNLITMYPRLPRPLLPYLFDIFLFFPLGRKWHAVPVRRGWPGFWHGCRRLQSGVCYLPSMEVVLGSVVLKLI